ncbi:Fidgetin-like protein 1 [Massospora cicadina]|nr:Fidgetin-like protein 1 [Massospora cicadina]
MASKPNCPSSTHQTFNLADIYRRVDASFWPSVPYLTIFQRGHFNPEIRPENLPSRSQPNPTIQETLAAYQMDIDELSRAATLLTLKMSHLFDLKPKQPQTAHPTYGCEISGPTPGQANRIGIKDSRSNRELSGRRYLLSRLSEIYEVVQRFREGLIREHYALCKRSGVDQVAPTGNAMFPDRNEPPKPVGAKARGKGLDPKKPCCAKVIPLPDLSMAFDNLETSVMPSLVAKGVLACRVPAGAHMFFGWLARALTPRPVTLQLGFLSQLTLIPTQLVPRQPRPLSLKDYVAPLSGRFQRTCGMPNPNAAPQPRHAPVKREVVGLPRSEPTNPDAEQVEMLSSEDSEPGGEKGSFITAKTYLKQTAIRKKEAEAQEGSKAKRVNSGLHKPFVNPAKRPSPETSDESGGLKNGTSSGGPKRRTRSTVEQSEPELVDPRLKNIEQPMIDRIKNEIMGDTLKITWDDIAGLDHAKKMIMEIVVWPMQRPDIFKGLLSPPRACCCLAPRHRQGNATFFSISSSSLTSKWIGDGEKMVRALFAVARCHQPAVVFVDEIDSLLTQRSDNEVEASRRIKTEFLVQLDGCATSSDDRLLVIGATNRPQEIDEAARRRFQKRVYIALPEPQGRRKIITNLLRSQNHSLTEADLDEIARLTHGYSGSDMDGLCREAALGPIRSIVNFSTVTAEEVRPITRQDFQLALRQVRASVDPGELDLYLQWNSRFGSLSTTPSDDERIRL